MKKTGIIGMGVISRHYLEGLKNSKKLSLVAICDKADNFETKSLYADYRYYADYIEMIKAEKLDYVIISTPPASHYQVALDCLNCGVNVIIEKPVVLEMKLLTDLVATARKKGLDFQVMYHWQNGEEVEVLLKEYDKSLISKISVRVLDPYSDDGVSINDNKVKLEGAWIDSGVNALSYVKCFLAFDNVEILSVDIKRCFKTNLPIAARAELKIDNVDVEITVDWTKGINQKQSVIICDGREIKVSHSDQTIYDGQKVTICDDMIRLTRHYYNFFTKNIKDLGDADETIRIHEVLFKVRDSYEN